MAMGSTGNLGARTVAKYAKVLLPASSHKLRISDELARHLDGGDGATALVVNPFGKVWRVEVGRDSEGAFLGHGWPEFAGAHGIGVGWFLVFRHEGGGVLTVKAFDTSCCLKEFGRPLTVAATRSSTGGPRRPQFVKVLLRGFMEKMLIPAEFVKRYISEEQLNSRVALLFSPLGKFCRIKLEKDRSDVFFGGGWSQFLAFHGVTESDALLLRYEGNMVFTVKAFGLNGCQKEFKDQDIKLQQTEQTFTEMKSHQETPSSTSSRKHKSRSERPSALQKKSAKTCRSVYEIGPPPWIKKEINNYALERGLPLARTFFDAIGFWKSCTITLKTSMNSTRSWQVRGRAYEKSCYLLGEGWKRFCKVNKLKEGDVCTFNVVETALWHVVIARC